MSPKISKLFVIFLSLLPLSTLSVQLDTLDYFLDTEVSNFYSVTSTPSSSSNILIGGQTINPNSTWLTWGSHSQGNFTHTISKTIDVPNHSNCKYPVTATNQSTNYVATLCQDSSSTWKVVILKIDDSNKTVSEYTIVTYSETLVTDALNYFQMIAVGDVIVLRIETGTGSVIVGLKVADYSLAFKLTSGHVLNLVLAASGDNSEHFFVVGDISGTIYVGKFDGNGEKVVENAFKTGATGLATGFDNGETFAVAYQVGDTVRGVTSTNFVFLNSTDLTVRSNSQLNSTQLCSPRGHQSHHKFVFACGAQTASYLTWVFDAQFKFEVSFKTKNFNDNIHVSSAVLRSNDPQYVLTAGLAGKISNNTFSKSDAAIAIFDLLGDDDSNIEKLSYSATQPQLATETFNSGWTRVTQLTGYSTDKQQGDVLSTKDIQIDDEHTVPTTSGSSKILLGLLPVLMYAMF
mmetsp:Transcript_40739/g.46881  ORF Transcript_40739/g.46881 Transcript_40739/m.46881 type:complete len:461 (-) Transcript_40739:482-1864(-)